MPIYVLLSIALKLSLIALGIALTLLGFYVVPAESGWFSSVPQLDEVVIQVIGALDIRIPRLTLGFAMVGAGLLMLWLGVRWRIVFKNGNMLLDMFHNMIGNLLR